MFLKVEVEFKIVDSVWEFLQKKFSMSKFIEYRFGPWFIRKTLVGWEIK